MGLIGQDLEKDSLERIHELIDSKGEKGLLEKAYFAVKELVKEKIRLYCLSGRQNKK